MSALLSDLVVRFASYMQMRKNANRHTDEQDKNFKIFCTLLNNYKNGDNVVIPEDSAIPSIMSQYMRSIPKYERESLDFQTIHFMIIEYNRIRKEKNKIS